MSTTVLPEPKSSLGLSQFTWSTPSQKKPENTASRKIRPSPVHDFSLENSRSVETTNLTGTLYIYCLTFRSGIQQQLVELKRFQRVLEYKVTGLCAKSDRIIANLSSLREESKRTLDQQEQERPRKRGKSVQTHTQRIPAPSSGAGTRENPISLLTNSEDRLEFLTYYDGSTVTRSLSKRKEVPVVSEQVGSYLRPICL